MNHSGKLFLIGTPIGNLGDVTLRALEVLRAVDAIACEDTRQTQKLLSHYDIHVPLVSFHDHSGPGKLQFLVREMMNGKKIALVSDSGTPLLSDPGFPLVREALGQGIALEVIPGPTAFLTALVGSGIPCEKFIFEGYPPQKDGSRKNFLQELRDEKRTMVFYESPHRIQKTLKAMTEVFGERNACLARELTKKFEEYLRGNLSAILEEVLKREKLGEMVIVVEGARN